MQQWNFDVSNSDVQSMRHQLASKIESLFSTRQKRARSPPDSMTEPASVPAPVSVPVAVPLDVPVPASATALVSVPAQQMELADSPEQDRAVPKRQSLAPNTSDACPAEPVIAQAPPATTTTASATTSVMRAPTVAVQHDKDAATAALIAGVLEHYRNWSEIARDPRFSSAATLGRTWMRQRWRIVTAERQKTAPVASRVYAFQKIGVQSKYDRLKDSVSAILGRQVE